MFMPSDRQARNRSFSVPNYPGFEAAQPLLGNQAPVFPPYPVFQPPPSYGSVAHIPWETQYGIPLHPMYNVGFNQPMIPPQMMPYHPPPQMAPVMMNPAPVPLQIKAPEVAPNIVVNANGGGSGGNVAAAMMGGFVCPFCHVGVQMRYRNPAIKCAVITASILLFPIGLLSCFCCCLPCAYKSKCTTCNMEI
ncbi:hypothetical protein FO519_007535 [Halicephalobus sp. NKZ332]|nr:hypothetical protein FO519_007535 [Halicephalobus sp. NKZ332]